MKKIVLLMGGETEREVSLMSADEMLKAIDASLYSVTAIDVKPNDGGKWVRQLMDEKPDTAMLALHGGIGENGAVQGLLECLSIPYVGSGVLSSALCMDKSLSKFILRANHIPVADDIFLAHGEDPYERISDIVRLGFPLVVKPNGGGSSVGVSIARDLESLVEAVYEADEDGGGVLIEKFVKGTEITCSVIETPKGPEVLPVLDITADGAFYDYEAKYISDLTNIKQSELPPYQQSMTEEIAVQSFTALRCGGYARVDMIVFEEQVTVLEVNTLPGMTSHSLFPKAAAYAGLTFQHLIQKLLDNAKIK